MSENMKRSERQRDFIPDLDKYGSPIPTSMEKMILNAKEVANMRKEPSPSLTEEELRIKSIDMKSLTTLAPDFFEIMSPDRYELLKKYFAFHKIVSSGKYKSLKLGDKIRYWVSLISGQEELREELLGSERNKIFTYLILCFVFVCPAILAVMGIPFIKSILSKEIYLILAFILPLLFAIIVIYKRISNMINIKEASKIVQSAASRHLRELAYEVEETEKNLWYMRQDHDALKRVTGNTLDTIKINYRDY